VTTTFHFETNEPQYEYSYEGAEVQLRCQGLVAAAAGPAATFDDYATPTWFELSPVSGKRILAGVGRVVPGATASSAFETKETTWAKAMAGLDPLELVESSGEIGDSVYALVDPTNGRVELGRAGLGVSALILDGDETRVVPFGPSGSDLGHSASFETSAGSTLLLLTHDRGQREMVIAATKRALAARSVERDQVDAVLECCLEILNGPLRQGESIVALHFERPGGSPIKRSPSDPPPITGEVVRDEAFVADRNSKCGSHHFKHHRERCRRREREGTRSEDSETSDHRCLPWLRRRSARGCEQCRGELPMPWARSIC
jgi:hypothetical protein